LPDEAGDGINAGPISDWGFADVSEQNRVNNVNSKQILNNNQSNSIQPYSDDEFEEDIVDGSPNKESASKKRQKQKLKKQQLDDSNNRGNNYDSSILVPIVNSCNNQSRKNSLPVSSKNLSTSTSLPQI